MTRPRITLAIITKNEEANIKRCIESVSWADDVVVLDSQSTDRTAEIARSMGARVFIEEFKGFRAQKQRVTDLAAHEWVLSLDADEALSPDLSGEILAHLDSEPQLHFDGLEMPRLSFYLGRWIKHGGWYPDYQLRLFHKRRAVWVGGHVHEHVKAENTLKLKHPIHHFVFDDLADQVATNNLYSSKGALDLRDKGKKFSFWRLLLKPYSKFIETYVIKLGFLDGLPGFIISVGAAYSIFLKFAKLWEMERLKAKAVKGSISSKGQKK